MKIEAGKKYLMGILNVTPDSLYDGGAYADHARAVDRALAMEQEGADIIDVGGESTRPGAPSVPLELELDRVIPVIRELAKKCGIPVSVDTSRAEVARQALDSGAAMINDVSAFTRDPAMAPTVARSGSFAVLMHMQGTPETMQNNPVYADCVAEIAGYLEKAARRAEESGVSREHIILDPGIGFGKTLEDNYRILNHIGVIKKLGYPVLIGLSRKSLIGKLYPDERDRLPGTIALNSAAILAGADMIRVHDVREHRLALDALAMLGAEG